MLSQYASAAVETTSATVERTTQYLRRYLECDESEIAPVTEVGVLRRPRKREERTNKRLGNQPANRASKPDQTCNLLRYTKR